LKAAAGKKLFGVFGKDQSATAMSYDIDRDPSVEPSLAEMTAKAIEILSANPKGFFLMVEGSKVDWAAHANDPVGLVSDIIAFDDAVKVALDFAKQDGQTLVVAVSDHGNSGMSIADRTLSSGYDKTPWTTFVAPLKKAKVSGEGLESKLATRIKVDGVYEPQEAQAIRDIVAQNLGITDLSDAEVETIGKTKVGSMNYTVGPMIGTRAKLGYTTNGHTGEDVVLYCYDPFGTRLSGLVPNTEIAHYMARTLNVDLAKTTARLFQDAESMFAKKGATVATDKSDPENPVLVVTKGDQVLRIPRNKNYAYLNGMAVNSDGVAVYNGTKWYVAKNLVDLVK
jgi:alkaline phosphatase